MTRGRKKDLTIPPSRALAQQRDYRARKAEYVYSLSYEQDLNIPENNAVRGELELAKAGVPTMFSPQAVCAVHISPVPIAQ